MQRLITAALMALGFAGVAGAQPTSRFTVGPVVRMDKIAVEGSGGGVTPVAGVAATVHISKIFGVEGEITRATRAFGRSYEGWFFSYAPQNATREEIERMAPTARRTLGYTPGIGWSAAFVARGDAGRRVRMGGRVGLSARKYQQSSSFTILTIPDGIDPALVARSFVDETYARTRGGLLFGGDVDIAVTDRFSLAPEVRFVYGGPARVGNKYSEIGFGAKATWAF